MLWNRLNKKAFTLAIMVILTGCSTAPSVKVIHNSNEHAAIDTEIQQQFATAQSYIEAEQFDQALPILEKLAQQRPDLSGPLASLGIIYAHMGRIEDARESFQNAVKHNPDNTLALNNLGIMHRELGEFNAAQTAYEQALRVDPDYAAAHLNLAILLDIYIHNPGQALAHYRRYQALSGSNDEQVELWIADAQNTAKRMLQDNQVALTESRGTEPAAN